jgi:salicylate hydroxylase
LTVRNILIIGAGMGGLTTALSFARAGHEVHLVEQAPALSEVGAGLQVSPNASRILIGLGLGEALQRAMVHPHEIVLASGGSLRKITHVPCGAFAAERWGAPYGVMHRADLQTLLLDAVNAQPNCHLHLGQRISSTGIGELANRLGLPRPDLVVGADGVWSEIRKLIKGTPSPRFSGQVAWRFKVPTDVARPVLNPASVTAFLGPRTHLVAYPLEKGKSVNMVAITRGNDPGQTWAQREQPDRRQDLLAAFSGWHRDLDRNPAPGAGNDALAALRTARRALA